jgi:hypothetical protein
MSSDEIIAWCRQHNVLVRFESNNTVSVRFNGSVRRRKTLAEAITAHLDANRRAMARRSA